MAYAASFRIQPALTIDEATAQERRRDPARGVRPRRARTALAVVSGAPAPTAAAPAAAARLARHHRPRPRRLVRLRPRAARARATPARSARSRSTCWCARYGPLRRRRRRRWSSRWSASGPSGRVERRLGIKDPQIVCIDEVAGVLVTWIAAPPTWRGADRRRPRRFACSTSSSPGPRARAERLGGGAGVMLDDVAAGVWGAALVLAGRALGWL